MTLFMLVQFEWKLKLKIFEFKLTIKIIKSDLEVKKDPEIKRRMRLKETINFKCLRATRERHMQYSAEKIRM